MTFMKKKLVYAAVALAMAGCADDALVSTEKNSESEIGKLVKAGLVSSAREDAQTDNATRALSPVGNFVWMPRKLGSEGENLGKILNESNQRVGFCWTGVDNSVEEDYGAIKAAGTNVFTNYEFEHVGWLDRNANSVEFDECTGELMNGAYIKGQGTEPEADVLEAEGMLPRYKFAANGNATYYKSDKDGHARGQRSVGNEKTIDLALGNGVFKTENASVFQGQYLVYYPYTDMFTKGPVIANEPSSFNVNMDSNEMDRFVTYSDYGFCLGWMEQYDGGNRSTGFNSTNFASFATIQLVNDDPNTATAPNPVYVESVILYSANADILVQKGINAGVAIDWLKGGAQEEYFTEDAAIYTQTDQDNKVAAVYANLSGFQDSTGTKCFKVLGAANDDPIKEQNVIIPVLPQTVKDLQVLVIKSDGTSRAYGFKDQQFKAGKASIMKVNVFGNKYEKEYLAYDEPSLVKAMKRVYALGEATALNDRVSKVKILNNIQLLTKNDDLYEPSIYNLVGFKNNVTITADPSNSKASLTTTSGTIRSIMCMSKKPEFCTLTIEVPCIIEGYGCCGDKPGKLSIGGKAEGEGDSGKGANVIFTNTVTNYGTLALGNSSNESNINIAELVNGWDDEYVTNQIGKSGKRYTKGSLMRGKLTDAAKVYMLGTSDATTNITIGKLTNNGGDIIAQTGTIDGFLRDDAEKDLTINNPTAKENRTINITINENVENFGKLKNGLKKAEKYEEKAGGTITIGKSVMVTVKGAVNNNDKLASVHIVGEGKSSTTDGRIDINGSGTNVGTIDNQGVINILQKLNNRGLFLDRLNAEVGGVPVYNGEEGTEYIVKYLDGIEAESNMYRTDLNKNGIYAAQVNTDYRMSFVLSDDVVFPSTNVVEILGNDKEEYNLSTYANDLRSKDVRIALDEFTTVVRFSAYNKEKKSEKKCFGDCVDIIKGYLVTRNGLLSTVKDLSVYSESTYLAGTVSGGVTDKSSAEIGRNLYNLALKSKVWHLAELLTVQNDIINHGTFQADKPYNVGHDVQLVNGTFDSNDGPNTIGNNFVQTGGKSEFAYKTTTTINGTFSCTNGGEFEREALGDGNQYRATVNVGKLGSTEGGHTNTAWPTTMLK